MKKLFIHLIVYIMVFSCFSCALIKETKHEHEHGLYELLIHNVAAEDYGTCPYCGEKLEGRVTATCTNSGSYFFYCPNGDYSDRGTMDALGHDYVPYIEEEATCTKDGVIRYECSRCQDSYKETKPALGHNYLYRITKEATCTQQGERTYTCTRCYDRYYKPIEALGHDFEYEEVEATCTEDGYKKGVCKRCGEESNEIYPALGHKLGAYKITKEATCTENGEKEAICSICNETIREVIPKLGHKYPDEWTTEKPAGYFAEGLETKTCSVCGEKMSRVTPKKDPTPLYIGAVVGIVVLVSSILTYLIRKKRSSVKREVEEIADKDLLKPEFEDRTILVSSSNEELILSLKGKQFLKVIVLKDEELTESVKENEPDLLIYEASEEKVYRKLMKLKKEELSELDMSLILDKELIKKQEKALKKLKEEKKIVDYVTSQTDVDVMQVKLVLPILKPKMNSDESLTNIGMVADALGIPCVSKVIDIYVTGRDLKSVLEEEEKGVNEVATIIADIASILGLDTVASVAGLVDDVDSIKTAVNKESGVHEKSAGIEGAKDIVDVVSDIVNRD